jgi:biotin carboxylase
MKERSVDGHEPATLTHRRVLLLVPRETYRAADFISAAVHLGVEVVIGSDGALPLGIHRVIPVHTDDVPRSVAHILDSAGHLDAVVAVDTAMLVLAAAVAERVGVPHNPVEAVQASMDKTLQRGRWAICGIPQPAFQMIPGDADDQAIRECGVTVGFPCVVKAVSLSGSRGVLRADTPAAVVEAAHHIRSVLRDAGRPDTEPLLVEEYVPGKEISVDALLSDGTATVIAVFDKPEMSDGPTFEETMLVTPPRLSDQTLTACVAVAERAAQALGLRHGPIHAELRIDMRDGTPRPRMLEVAARSIGGLCARALRFADGCSFETLILLNALGGAVQVQRETGAAGVFMLPVERAGVLRAIEGRARAETVPGITDISITIPLGQVVQPLPEGDRYLGFIFAADDTPENVTAALRTARQHLHVVIERAERVAE